MGAIMGIVIFTALCSLFAPSIWAASYNSGLIPAIAAIYTIDPQPIPLMMEATIISTQKYCASPKFTGFSCELKPKNSKIGLNIPVVISVRAIIIAPKIVHDMKCGNIETVCMLFLKRKCVTSLINKAKIMGAGKLNISNRKFRHNVLIRILTSAEITEEQFDKLVSLDTAFYNNDRRAHDHKTSLAQHMAQKHKKGPVSVEEKEDEELRLIQDDIIEQSDDATVVATFSEEDRTIYSLCVEQHLTQTETAKALGKSQSYIAKHMAKIEERLAVNYADTGERTKDEVYAIVQWEKYKEKQRTDDDEDMLWDMFLYLLPAEEEEEIKSWFYGDREFFKFGLTYIILRPFKNCSDIDFWKRLANMVGYKAQGSKSLLPIFPQGGK